MKPGIEIVMQAVKLEEAVKEASLVITGEGRIDSQTAGGKAPIGVASVAKRHHVPVIGIAGVLGDGVEVVHRHGIDAVFSILPRLAPLPEVLANGEQNLYHSACNIARVIKLGGHRDSLSIKSHGSHRGKINIAKLKIIRRAARR